MWTSTWGRGEEGGELDESLVSSDIIKLPSAAR